jgi:hypothetical protein
MRRGRTSLALALSAALSLAPAPALARRSSQHSSELDAAQSALGRLRFEEARDKLERAWRSGDNGPAAMALLFRLQGEVAATLGDVPAARRAFARWLALDPKARLDEGASPKFVAAFEAARDGLAGAALRVDVEVAPGGHAVTLVISSDPLDLAAGARVSYTGEGGVQSVAEGKGGPRIQLPLPGTARLRVVVAALDGYGNRLVERELIVQPDASAPAVVPAPPAPRVPVDPHDDDDDGDRDGERSPDDADEPPARDDITQAAEPEATRGARSERSFLTSPWLWAGVGVGFAAAGGYFAWRVGDTEAELAELNAHSAEHPFSEAQTLEDQRSQSATFAAVGFAAAGASVLAAILLALDREPAAPAPATLGLRPTRGGADLVLEWSF